jgi:hypothetical protein
MKWPPTPAFFFNHLQFLLLHKRCNQRSDGIFQILSRNLLPVSGDAAQMIFTPSSALPELASCVKTIQRSSCIFVCGPKGLRHWNDNFPHPTHPPNNGPCHVSGIPLQKANFSLSQRDFYFINCC